MCFDSDSRPPIVPIAGGALESGRITLTASDGTPFAAFRARAAEPTGAGIVILPDVRGLYRFYEELALRFAENGIDAVAIDYFGRTAGLGPRGDDFDHMSHVQQMDWSTASQDIRSGAAYLRSTDGGAAGALFSVGFCFGGRLSFDAATLGLGLAGTIGFYGVPVGPGRANSPAPVEVADRIEAPVLGLFGGADQSIPPDARAAFETALTEAGVEHRLVTYDGATHSFFDRKADEFREASEGAWREALAFIRLHSPAHA
jgi:carboxymethylenebutenolidase